ncbi:MAG: IMP dehydrogenase [Opitutales bacterium]
MGNATNVPAMLQTSESDSSTPATAARQATPHVPTADPAASTPLSQSDDAFYQPADVFFAHNAPFGLTYDDVTLATAYSEVLPRQTSLDTLLSERIRLPLPILSADMDTVTEAEMAIAMARNGGLGLIHYNMSERDQVRQVGKVKNNIHGLIQEPIKVGPNEYISDVLAMIDKKGYKFSTFPVVDARGVLLGLLPGRVVKERYADRKVADSMQPRAEVRTIREADLGENAIAAADAFFDQNFGIHKLLVVDDDDRLRGLFTLSDIERINDEQRTNVRPARDAQFRLLCGAAVTAPRTRDGALDRDRLVEHVTNLVGEGLDVVAVSTAHGFSKGVGEAVRLVRDQFPDLTLIAGNVTSGAGVEFLAEAGADVVKVGQGPGSICTTRIVAGVGIPQLTAVYLASRAAQKKGVRILADGGLTKSGDIVKALTLADAVMCGGMLAGCAEAPGNIIEINGKLYKQYRGMGSHEAMKAGSAARYGHDANDYQPVERSQGENSKKASDMGNGKVAAEGIEALKEIAGPADQILGEIAGGIQSGLGYLGARNLAELRTNARYIRITQAGLREAAPHDVVEVKTTKES